MRRFVLLPVFAASLIHAGSLTFKPDTVRSGYGSSASRLHPEATTAINSSSSVATISLKRLVTPFLHTKKRVSFIAQNSRAYIYRIDSTVPRGSLYIQHLSRDTSYQSNFLVFQQSYSTYRALEIQLLPNASATLGGFRLEDCQAYVVRALATGPGPARICSDEPVELVFEVRPGATDTLHLRAGQWSLGIQDGPHSSWPAGSAGDGIRYSPDGKVRAGTRPNEILGIGTFVRGAVGE